MSTLISTNPKEDQTIFKKKNAWDIILQSIWRSISTEKEYLECTFFFYFSFLSSLLKRLNFTTLQLENLQTGNTGPLYPPEGT